MTTRAGLIGIICGIIGALLFHILIFIWDQAIISDGAAYEFHWILRYSAILLLIFCGYISARWNQSIERWRCVMLGVFSGFIAGLMFYSLFYASFVITDMDFLPGTAAGYETLIQYAIQQTVEGSFVLLLLAGFFGGFGGITAHPGKTVEKDQFNLEEPQMAMNVSITAVCTSIVAVAITASTFPALSTKLECDLPGSSAFLYPLFAALLLLVISQIALTQVVPHETQQAEHVSGMDEVKMAAFVDIGTGPLLILILLIIDPQLLLNKMVLFSTVCSTGLSLYSIQLLINKVLPKRKSYPKHPSRAQETQAALFGSIAKSRAWRLVTLCIGCGMAMVFPIYITVLAPLININAVSENAGPIVLHSELANQLFRTHLKTSMGLNLLVILLLSGMYIFYLNLGRWFNKRQTSHR